MNKQGPTGIEWRPVPGYEGYFADSDGNIYSEWIPIPNGRRRTGNFHRLKPSVKSHGYMTIDLKDSSGATKTVYVHRIVALTFHGSCPDKMNCCHNDGDKLNNRAANLRYDTQKNNCRDTIAHGTSTRGARHNTAKLTELDVMAIRSRLAGGESQSSVARAFGVGHSAINYIKHGKSWGWLK